MKKTKDGKLTNIILAVVLSVVFVCTTITSAVFAVDGANNEMGTETSSSDVQDDDSSESSSTGESSNQTDESSESSDQSSESSSDDSSNSSQQSSSETANSDQNTIDSTTPTPQNPTNSLAVGTKFTIGNYMYMVTSANTVSLKGFAKNVSVSTISVKNTVDYNGTTYNVTKIGTEAFKGENGVKKVILSKNITDIGKRSFYKCKNLNKVRIKYNVKIIRKGAFRYCSKLKTINITSTVLTDIRVNVFNGIKSGAVVNVMNDPVRKLVKANIPKNVTVNMM